MVLSTNNDIYIASGSYNNTIYVYDTSGTEALTIPSSSTGGAIF